MLTSEVIDMVRLRRTLRDIARECEAVAWKLVLACQAGEPAVSLAEAASDALRRAAARVRELGIA